MILVAEIGEAPEGQKGDGPEAATSSPSSERPRCETSASSTMVAAGCDTEDEWVATPADEMAFLRAVHGLPADGRITVFALHRSTRAKVVRHVRSVLGLHRAAQELAPEHDVYHGLATMRPGLEDGRRGGQADAVSIRVLHVDVDVQGPGHARADLPPTLAAGYELAEACPMWPSAVVESGGGLQMYWLLDRRLTVAEVLPVLARWRDYWRGAASERGWHIDSTWDIARVLRVPGTLNWKTGTARPVELAVWCPERVYTVSDVDALPVPERPAPPRPAMPQPPRYQNGDGTPWGARKLENVCAEIASIPIGEGRRWAEANDLVYTVYRSVAGGEIDEVAADRRTRAALWAVYPDRTDRDLEGMWAAQKAAGLADPLVRSPAGATR